MFTILSYLSLMEFHFPSLPVILAFLIFMFMLLRKFIIQATNSKLPPGPRKLPLIGNLHNMLLGRLPHRTLGDLAKQYGPLMHLQLGEVSTIVVSSPKVAEQFMKTHDLIFAERPQVLVIEALSSGVGVSFAPYGSYWRQMKKLLMLELLSSKRVQSFRYIREEEVTNLIQRFSLVLGSSINFSERIFAFTTDVTSRAAFGKKCKDKESFVSCMHEIVKLAGGFDICDMFPSVKFLRLVSRMKHKLEESSQEMDKIIDNIIMDHRGSPTRETKMAHELEEDLVDVLIRVQGNHEFEPALTTENIKATIMDIFAAGTDTSSTILEWAMSELMKNPRVMEKVQAEVRQVFSGKKQIDEIDLHKLDYLNLVIKETLRLHPAGPLLLPRECREKCEINGYEIPKKAKVIVNAWTIARDPEYWSDAEKFEPERFSSGSIDFRGTNFEYIPFGAGRRMCPGISFGIANIELPLAQLLYHFDWKLPDGIRPEDLDMSETFGSTVRRRNDLHLIPTPCSSLSSSVKISPTKITTVHMYPEFT